MVRAHQADDQFCRKCANIQGLLLCVSCMKHFCENCKKHRICSPTKDNTQQIKCTDHNESYKFYCKSCDKPVCSRCKNDAHSIHEIKDLHKVVEEMKTYAQMELRSSITNARSSFVKLMHERISFKNKIQYTIRSIKEHGEEIKKFVDSEINQLVQNLSEKLDNETQKLSSVERNLMDSLDKGYRLQKTYNDAARSEDKAYALETLKQIIFDCGNIQTYKIAKSPSVRYTKSTVLPSVIENCLGDIIYEPDEEKGIETPEMRNEYLRTVNLELSEETFPRIANIKSWLEGKGVDVKAILGVKEATETLHYYLKVLHANTIEPDTLLNFFDGQMCPVYMLDKDNVPESRKLDKDRMSEMPNVVVFYLEPTINGFLTYKDKEIIKAMLDLDETEQIDVLYVTDVNVSTDLEKFLENLGDDISRTLEISKEGHNIHRKIFTRIDDSLKQRIGLYLERQIKSKVISFVTKDKSAKPENESGDLSVLTSPQNDALYSEILDELQEEHPDNCELHELETCLERMKNVSAFGIDEHEITIYIKENHELPKVKTDLEAYMPEIKAHMTIKVWCQDMEIERYHLKQGSKITRSDDHFGTLGMFFMDMDECLYFTTCAHVIPREHPAFDENKICLGKSIFEIEASLDRGQKDRMDLSIVKVEGEITPRCQLGLRNVSDKLISGKITDNSVIKSEVRKGLKVYKWGAKSGLTRGTYKGLIAKKNDDDIFDHILHKIKCDSGEFAEKGDSGSLVCFEATGSPQFQSESAAYIFVGKLDDNIDIVEKEDFYLCFHISNIFDCRVDNVLNLEPCLQPCNTDGDLASGSTIQSSENV